MMNEASGDRQKGRHLAEGDHQTPNEKGDDTVAQQRAQRASTAKRLAKTDKETGAYTRDKVMRMCER